MKTPDEILAMSKAKRRKWVKAIDKVYGGYKESVELKSCPFCDISNSCFCSDCLWPIIEKIVCMRFSEKKIGCVVPFSNEILYPKWKRIRYPMLRKWRRMLVKAGV